MNRFKCAVLFVFLYSVLFQEQLLQAQDVKKVLMIGIDGCRPNALQQANTPNIDGLIADGLYSPDALNDDITISGPGWSAILCGVWSDKHLVTDNSFSVDDYPSYPSLVKRIEDSDSNLNTVSICHWTPINTYIVQGFADYAFNASSDQSVSDEAVNYITNNDPDFMFLHFDDVDGAGHANGFSPDIPPYISAIEATDTFIGPVLTAIENRPNYANEDWLILVTTDHGGINFSHGGNTIEEKTVFAIASGKNVPTTVIHKDSTVVLDNPLNCLTDNIQSQATELQFDGDGDFVEVPNDPIFDFGANRDFTIECRVRTNVAGDVAIVGNKDWDSGGNKGFVFSFKYPSGPEWKVNIGDGSNRADLDNGGLIADNEWHTLSVSFDRDGLMRMYEDGVFVDETDISFIGDITNNEGLFMGLDIDGDYDYSGSLAEVRVWDKVVDASTIADWHCTEIDPAHPDYTELLGYWKLDEGQATTATDYSTFGNDGTIQNAQWNSADSIVVYDYSNTPKLTDMVPTALTHLCIPLDPAWNLDGVSLIEKFVQMDLSVNVLLEGAMNASGTMNAVLSQGSLLVNHPYDIAPYNYTGPIPSGFLIPTNAVDYILIELRRPLDTGDVVVAQQVAFILDNGDIVLEDGSLPSFWIDQALTYEVWIRHHNHLDIIASEEITPAPLVVRNFNTPSDAMGPEQLKDVGNGGYAMFAGDINHDGTISVTDYDVWFLSPAILDQYLSSDTNLDGSVQTTDYDLWFKNKAKIGFAQNQD